MKPDTSSANDTFVKGLSWETFSNLVCFGLAYAGVRQLRRLCGLHADLLRREADPFLLPRTHLASIRLGKANVSP